MALYSRKEDAALLCCVDNMWSEYVVSCDFCPVMSIYTDHLDCIRSLLEPMMTEHVVFGESLLLLIDYSESGLERTGK